MSALGIVGGIVQPLLVVGGSPLLVGPMRQVRAKLEGRAGPGVGQPWRDLRKLLRKEAVTPRGTSEVFRFAPLVLVATTLVVAVVVPFVTTASAVDPVADLFAVVTLGTVALALAGLDTGTAFGGMGASREMTIIALVEPTLLVAIFALSVRVGTNPAAIVSSTLYDRGRVTSPVSLLAAVALIVVFVVIVAETVRLPVDNPSTRLELTMVHEAILEYAGPDLALLELASAMRMSDGERPRRRGGPAARPRNLLGDFRRYRILPARGARCRTSRSIVMTFLGHATRGDVSLVIERSQGALMSPVNSITECPVCTKRKYLPRRRSGSVTG